MVVCLCAVAAWGKGMCFFLSAQQVRMCTALWQNCPAGKAQWVLRVQLLPRRGLVWSCCVVETYSTHGKALLRRGMVIFIFTGWCLFSMWYSMEENAGLVENVANSPFCDNSQFPSSAVGWRLKLSVLLHLHWMSKMSLTWTLRTIKPANTDLWEWTEDWLCSNETPFPVYGDFLQLLQENIFCWCDALIFLTKLRSVKHSLEMSFSLSFYCVLIASYVK